MYYDQDVRFTISTTSSSLSSVPAAVKASFLEAWPGAKMDGEMSSLQVVHFIGWTGYQPVKAISKMKVIKVLSSWTERNLCALAWNRLLQSPSQENSYILMIWLHDTIIIISKTYNEYWILCIHCWRGASCEKSKSTSDLPIQLKLLAARPLAFGEAQTATTRPGRKTQMVPTHGL